MTIDTSWLASFKSEAPHAFTARIPFSPRAVFTDGQIRLMQGGYMQVCVGIRCADAPSELVSTGEAPDMG
jgi:hypothetical protein